MKSNGSRVAVVTWISIVCVTLSAVSGCNGSREWRHGPESYRIYWIDFNVETLFAVSTENIVSQGRPFDTNAPDVMTEIENVVKSAAAPPGDENSFDDLVVRVRIDKVQDGHAVLWAVVDREGHMLVDRAPRWLSPEARTRLADVVWGLYQKQVK